MATRPVKQRREKEGRRTQVYSNKGYQPDQGNNEEVTVTVDPAHRVYVSEPLEAEENQNCCTAFVTTVTESVGDLYKEHGTYIWGAVYCLLVVGYAVYFAFAMRYKFGDEGSIRLLWVTCVVIFCVVVHVIKRMFGSDIAQGCKPCTDWLEKYNEIISWLLVGLIWLVVVALVVEDIVNVSKSPYNLVSVAGMVGYILILYIFSYSPARVRWRPVVWGMALQFVLALFILRWPVGQMVFYWIADRVREFLTHTETGSRFLFGNRLVDTFVFFATVLPVIVFFSSVISILYYLGWIQVVIRKMAWVMQVTMGTTAGESLSAAGNIFVGMVEAPLMIRPLIPQMTRSELHAVMTGGLATIAGSVFGAYVLFGAPANHLLSASVMSAPAALAMAKLFYPETEKSKTTAKDVQVMEKSSAKNIVEAASAGASGSISLVANIAVILIAFLAIVNFIDETLRWAGERVGLMRPDIDFTLAFVMSYLFYPFAISMGVVPEDCLQVGRLIGEKIIVNEFVAYGHLGTLGTNRESYLANCYNNGTMKYVGNDIILSSGETLLGGILYSERSTVIATYALCGFSNFGSIGILIGAFGVMAPLRQKELSSLAVRAMIAGNVACFMTACIAGLFYEETVIRLYPGQCP